ncbi:MAG: ATP-binding protein [Coriobacteriia bacterium]|nr:ATP-binding protein [Coriobacteriia bacterium]MCL2537029.1 ATP-binding protein [Coriobacteriia bacterium]
MLKTTLNHRFLWDRLSTEIDTREATVITGPRQAGKSTTLQWMLDQVESDNKISLDLTLESTRQLFENFDAKGIIHYLGQVGIDFSSRAYIAIDEIQYSKELPFVVKYLIDHHQVKFFLSGSSSYYLKNQFSESMAGRKLIFELYPLSFQEFLNFKGQNYRLDPLFTKDYEVSKSSFSQNAHSYHTLKAYYDEFIEYGGFPRVVLEPNIDRKKALLAEIFTSYIDLDVEHLSDFRSKADLRNLIRVLAARTGSRININDLSIITGLSQSTTRTYIDFLEKTYLIRLLPVSSSNQDVITRKQPKLYFIDTGIASQNADLSGGAKFENTLCHQLQRYGQLSYFDNRGEIDFILTTDQATYALEAKESPTPKDKKELSTRADRLGVPDYNLIGRNHVAKYDNYLWGGLIP